MDIQNREVNFRLHLVPGELIKIDIGGVKVFEETVATGTEAKLTFKYQENIPES